MICLNCGKEIDNDLRVCPYCGNLVELFDDSVYYEEAPLDPVAPQYVEESYEEGYAEDENYAGDESYEEEFVDDDPVYGAKKFKGFGKGGKKMSMPSMPAVSMPKLPAINLSAVFSLACLVLSVICLISIKGVQKDIEDTYNKLNSSMSSVYSSVSALDSRLANMDSTIAGVQSEAYAQFSSQAITITKDITALTGPVSEGKYNIMFIVNAKGNLNLSTSFDWQKYNSVTGGWESIVFTGNATTNEQYGLRLENAYDNDEQHYSSTLWANGITPDAAGSYRCVIKDNTGITKTSAEASVQVN